MKLKQFIFVLVAMLSFSFSSFAQSTVSTAAELKAALESTTGGEFVLGDDITLPAQITVPKKTTHTLDLNGHDITGGIYVYGTLTINDEAGTGSITANSYVLNGAGGSKIILNGGRIYRGSSWSVYTTGIFVVNGGEVENTIRVAGSGSIQLNGGTVTAVQVTSGNLNITGDAVVEGNLNIEKGAKGVNIAGGTINGDITIATEATDKVAVSGGSFKDGDAIKDYLPGGSALLEKPDGTYEIVAGLLKIGDTYYPTLAAALAAAADGATIELINQEGSVIAMNGSLYGKSVTITGTAKVDWSKGWLFVGRGGEGNATLKFDNANLTSVSNSSSYGIHVSGREKGAADKYDGTLNIKNSTIELDFLINKGAMTLDNSSLTVKNGFDLNGRPASETENGEDANATLALTNGSKLVVNNHNGMGIGREGKGELTVDATSTFEHTQDFIVRANGTMDVKGTLVSNGKKLTNNGEVKFTATKLTDATIEGTGTTRFYNDVNFYGANSIITSGINGTPFHLVINEGANLFITRFVLGYDRNITVNGTIADASAFNPEGQTPSLKFNSTSGVSVGGTDTGNLTVKNAYVELGSSSWKNAQGTYNWDFVNSYVSATSFTNATGADAATWDVTFDKSILAAKNYIKNGKNVTYNFTNNSRGTTGSLRIDGVLNIDATSSVVTTSQQNNVVGGEDEHGGINGTVNVAGSLTIGSNSKTQLEVLGGTVNVKEGATLALGNNTLTLDAASEMQSAGNISGAITAADGANVAISGGTYTQDVNKWCADGFMTQQNADGSFGIAKAVAKVGDKKYATLEEAFKAATSGCTIEIVSDVTVDYNWDARNTGGKFTVPVTIDGNGKTIKFTASVNDNNYQASFRFEADATVKNLIVDMSEVTDNKFRAISSKGNLTVDNSKFIGKDESLNCRAIIFGEGAGANVGNLAIAITNSEFINWKRGITDNENAQDVKTVTITGNTLTDAGVGVSAKEKVTFTGNTVEGAYVNIKSYTAGNKLAVTATGNTLEANTDAAYNVIDAGGVVNAEGFNIVAKGGNINGYTGADRIWGEVWGNAKESFVIKVLDANGNVMGTSSLNNIGGIIDGDVTVTWSISFDAPTPNPAAYWSMEWTTAPSISNMPAKVQLWVDGVKVSEGNVVLNGPDDLNKIVAAVTDADGKIISCHTSVASAASTNATNIALLRETTEEISLPVGTILNKNGFNAEKVTVKQPVVSIGDKQFATFAEALDAVENGQTITLINGVTGDEKSTEIEFTKDINFTITGNAPQYALPVVTFQNAEVTIKDAEILIPELDARQNAVINVVNSTVHDASGNSIAKSYYNGTINIDKTSTVYMMQITTMGYINVAGTVNATWQTNVYGNGMISLAQGATFNTGALHLTGQDYSGRDNTDNDRVGKPATIVVDGATLNVGSVKSDNGSDYSYNSSKGINVGTVDGKLALLDVKNGGAVNFHMANGQTTNFGAGATVNVAASTLKTISRDENGTVTLANNGVVNVTGASNLNIKNYSGNAINATNATLADVQFGGAVNAFGTNNISGTSVIGGILSLGYGTNPTEQVVVNITGNFNGTNVLISTNNGVDNILNVGKADGERTKVHFGQLGAFADVNVVNTDVTYGYAFIRNDFNATNSTFEIKGGVNTYFSGNAKVVLDNTTWALPGFANIGSYGGYMYGNADVTLKNGSSMTATNLGVQVDGEKVVKLTLEDNSSLTATNLTNQGSIVLASTEATLTSNECGNVTTSVANQVVSYIDGKYTLVAAIAQIGGTAYTSLQAAVNAVKNGETITLIADVAENVTLTEKVGLHYTLDGAGKQFKGSISVNSLSDTNDNRRITIKNIKFVDDSAAKVDFISSVNTNHYPRLTIEGCTFTGSGNDGDVAVRLKSSHSVVIKDCTGTGLHSFLQNTSGWNLTIENVKVTESKGAFALGTVQGVTIKGSTIDVATYGIRLDANTYNNNAVIEGNNVTAFIPVVVRNVNTQSNVTFTGENTFTAENTDGKWMVIGTTEYEAGKELPAEVAVGNVVVALNGTNLSYDGVHGAGLAGAGTADAPYLINNVAELEIFRASVNAGSTKYNAPGLWVALGADIDLANAEWTVGIGDGHNYSFDGNFDGAKHTIKNLNIKPYADADGYICGGLFGYTYGAVTIKNLTIENAKVEFTGAEDGKTYHNVGVLVGFANNKDGKLNVDNVTVKGDIKVDAPQTYGVGAIVGYSYRDMGAITNTNVLANEGSYIKGERFVGGITGYSYNGAVIDNCTVQNLAITGEIGVGGIAGLALNGNKIAGCTIKNVTVNGDKNVAYIVGELGSGDGGNVTVADNCNAPQPWVGGSYGTGESFVATIGTQYYTSVAKAIEAAKENDVITLIADIAASDIITINKAITLDGNGKTLTSTAARAINVETEGNVTIKNLTINAGERAINIINLPANVTVNNVTAKAKNNAVMMATSATGAKLTVNDSDFTGLAVVNVASENSQVVINKTNITNVDDNEAENYGAISIFKTASNATVVVNGGKVVVGDDSKAASIGAAGATVTFNGTEGNTDVQTIVAYIGDAGYTTLKEAIEDAKAGDVVSLISDITASDIITINKAITLDGNDKTLTSTAGRAINVSGADGVTIKNLIINTSGERAINVIQNATNVTIDGVTATAANYTVNVASSAPNAVVAINNSTLNGLCTVNVSAAGANVTVDNSTVNCNDNNTTAGEAYAALCLNKEAVGGSIVATNSTINVTEGSDSKKGRNSAENGTVTINGSTDGVAVMVAVITYEGSVYYHSFSSLAEAVEFAKAGDVITLISNVTVAQPVVINKSVTLDGNGKTLTYTGTDRAIEMPNVADANYDVTIKNLNVVATTANRGLNYNDNGKLNVESVTVTIGANVDGYAINFPGMADGAQVTIKDSKLTSRNPLNIWGENMTINVHNSEIISVDNSTTYDYAAIQLNNDLYGNVANGTVVNVYGGTITALNDNDEPSNVVANATETGVVNISDETVVTGKVLNYVANIGGAYFGSLQAAVNAIEKHGYNSPIVIMKDFATSEATTIKSGLKVTINLNGKTITGTDNATGSFGLITNKGNLTINGEGAITLKATNNREWNAYSSVISNTVGGKLTVNGGTIQHLGGTDMAYAIDNLTNGKGTYAETIINGGAVKSTYRAVRQFLNGTEAQNILTVNGGTIEGTNKSIWMQDPSKNSNTGTLTVAAGAKLTGDVYLTVTAGSTEWPVEVAVAAAALQGESKVLDNGNVPAGYDLALVNGTYGVYTGVAKIGTAYYETLKAAVAAAQAGETITLIDNVEASEVILLDKSLTINGNGHKVTSSATRVFRVTTANTEITLNGVNMVNTAVRVGTNDIRGISIDIVDNVKLTLNNCSVDFTDASANDWTYAVNVTGGNEHTVTVDGGTYEGANVINVRSTNSSVVVKNATLNCLYPDNAQYFGACIYVIKNNNTSVEATGNTFNGDNAYAFNLGNGNPLTESNNIDNTKYVVAMIGDAYYTSIQAAFAAAQNGETIKLTQNVKTSAAGYATVGKEGYAVIVAVKEKNITLDLNGKSVTVTPTAEELANAEGKMLMSVFGMDTNGKLTLTGNGSVKVNANGANVYSLVAAYGEGSAVVIENGNYEADAVMASGSLIYSHEMITVKGGTFKLGNLASGANGSPWIFNTIGQNYTGVTVEGGTYPTDINHQFWANEVLVPEAYALKNNGDGTWTVVDAVAYTNEKATSRNASWRHVGYASLEDAIAATGKYNCQDNTVTMLKDITLEPITVANGVEVAIDLNGKTISGTDNGTARFGLITNKGNLTINGTGAITLTATQNRGWNAYSSVISNQVGGKLTVNGGTIEHLGGTSMAWGIDNLTNGKGTYAETVINGGVVKSKYIAIRQFLNGVEADNILTVNGGTLEGETASLYFQDPNAQANSGTLNVLDGTLVGDVYLDVTEGSTEWPVVVYIAKDALGQNVIHTENVPAEAAALVEYDTFWQVEQKNLAELTIEDACEEYINKIEKNVGVLTYERYFDDTEWQTIVLPFDVPVAYLLEQFEVAYIYNASYKGKQATIDYVVIDENSVVENLSANYPYLIKAKAEGWNNIVVANAKLMPTKVEILDCSSIFEKFSFIGNYATVEAPSNDGMGYFNLTSGAWSKMDVVNPFRFYMQIKLRNGGAFEYPSEAQAIRMRSVNANGEATTGIDGVDAEQAGDFIFDLHGRRVVEPQKGSIYIVNGKKVMF